MDQSIEDILKTIDKAINKFQSAIPGIQRLVFEELQPLIKQIEIKDGKLLNNVNNLKLIGSLKNKLEKIILSPDYKKAVQNFLDSFTAVTNLQQDYFKQFNKDLKPKKTLPIIKQLAVESTINGLVGQGMSASVIDPIKKILTQNITTGGNYAKFQEQLRNHILTNDTGEGILERYTKQITTDSINQYNAQYHDAIAQDLQFNWGRYVGSNITTSREFCILLTKKQWVHKSELPEIIKGHIDNETCKLSKSTKLPLGMIPGTNPDNFKVVRGGYNCGHQFFWVPDSSVPANIKLKIGNNNSILPEIKNTIEASTVFDFRMGALKDAGALGKFGLHDYEAVSIHSYTGTAYGTMNKHLRGQEIGSYLTQAYIEGTKIGLMKLPEYKGQVFRGADLPVEQKNQYKKAFENKSHIIHDYFTSTSKASGKEFPGNTKFIIESKSGRDVAFLSKHGDDEEEILFNAGTKFIVTNFIERGDSTVIYLTEP
jgi:hypothetical protein